MKLNKLVVSMVLGAALSSSAYADRYVFGSSGDHTNDNGLHITTTVGNFFVATFASGWWKSTGAHDEGGFNYVAGVCCEGITESNYNNYFTFDLSSVKGAVLSAQLTLYSGDITGAGPLNYSLFDITSPLSDMRPSGNNVYRDLMSGANYGSFSYSSADSHELRSITLNSTGVSALNSAVGGEFGIGGSLAPIPEPETYALLLAGLGLLGWRLRSVRI